MRKIFLTEVVKEEYKNWCPGDVAFLSTPTGSGKTTFALNVYAVHIVAQGGRVLLLEPRTILVDQIRNELRRVFAKNVDDYGVMVRGVTVWTYQALEEKIQNGIHIPDFDAIIADEAHYFLADSTFNANTALSYDYLVRQNTKRCSVIVMMSATISKIREVFLKDAPHSIGIQSFGTSGKMHIAGNTAFDYVVEPDYGYLTVQYLTDFNEMLEIASAHQGKTLWFCSNKKRGEKILVELQARGNIVGMITAENKTDAAESIVKSLASRGKFTQKILVATSVLDVGVSIVDSEVASVVLDTYDRDTFIQMLGRVRMTDEGQRLNVYIFSRTAENFRNLLDRQLIPKLNFMEKIARVEEEFKPAEIVESLLNQPVAPAVYTQKVEILLNRLTNICLNGQYLSYLDFEEGLQKDSGYAIKKQLGWLGLEDTFSEENYVDVDVKTIKRNRIYQAIKEKGVGAMNGGLSKDEIAQFLEEIKSEIRNLNPSYVRSNVSLSVNKFNEICESEGLPFCIGQEEIEKKQKYSLIFKEDIFA